MVGTLLVDVHDAITHGWIDLLQEVTRLNKRLHDHRLLSHPCGIVGHRIVETVLRISERVLSKTEDLLIERLAIIGELTFEAHQQAQLLHAVAIRLSVHVIVGLKSQSDSSPSGEWFRQVASNAARRGAYTSHWAHLTCGHAVGQSLARHRIKINKADARCLCIFKFTQEKHHRVVADVVVIIGDIAQFEMHMWASRTSGITAQGNHLAILHGQVLGAKSNITIV